MFGGGDSDTDEFWRSFFEGLSSNGRIVVIRPMLERGPSQALLFSWENERRASWPGELPEFDAVAAEWGCRVLCLAARLLTDRLLEIGVLDQLIAAGPRENGPGTHYSVDLVLCVLPDLWRLASRRMRDDPLLEALKKLQLRWPLSAVGMPCESPVLDDLAPLRESTGLWTVFIDRVIAARKSEWLRLEEVRNAVSNAVGPERLTTQEFRELIAQPKEDANDRCESE